MEVTAELQDDALPELYKLPPEDITSYDDWRHDRVSGEEEEPAPDYSSSESGASDDEADDSLLRQSIGPRLNVLLSSDSCDDGSTGTGIGTGVGTGSTTDVFPLDHHDSERLNAHIATKVQLIEPKKLANPCRESRDHQDLHREMLMNKRMGFDVLNQKSELVKELSRRRATIKKKESDEVDKKNRTSFEIKLEEQANKLKQLEVTEPPIKEEVEKNEFLKVHSKISRAKSASNTS